MIDLKKDANHLDDVETVLTEIQSNVSNKRIVKKISLINNAVKCHKERLKKSITILAPTAGIDVAVNKIACLVVVVLSVLFFVSSNLVEDDIILLAVVAAAAAAP